MRKVNILFVITQMRLCTRRSDPPIPIWVMTNRKVNILFVITQMGMGGSERLVHNLALRLDRSRFNPSVAWLVGSEALKEYEDLQVPLHYVPKTKRVDFS